MLEPFVTIIINNKTRLFGCVEFNIKKDVDDISTKGYVVLPLAYYLTNEANFKITIRDKIKPGDRLSIITGYEQGDAHGFDMYVTMVNATEMVRIELEDEMYLFRKTAVVYNGKNVKVKDICNYLANAVNSNPMFDNPKITLSKNCADMTWDAVSYKGSAAGLLAEMKEKIYQTVNFNSGELYLGLQELLYVGDNTKKINATYGRNIVSNDVEYQTQESKPLEVIMKGKKKDNTETIVSYGMLEYPSKNYVIRDNSKIAEKAGMDVRTEMHADITDAPTLGKMAKTYFNLHCYDGFTGTITLWFEPFATPGGTMVYKNENYRDNEGSYFIKAVEYKFTTDGGLRQVVSLGQKL